MRWAEAGSQPIKGESSCSFPLLVNGGKSSWEIPNVIVEVRAISSLGEGYLHVTTPRSASHCLRAAPAEHYFSGTSCLWQRGLLLARKPPAGWESAVTDYSILRGQGLLVTVPAIIWSQQCSQSCAFKLLHCGVPAQDRYAFTFRRKHHKETLKLFPRKQWAVLLSSSSFLSTSKQDDM